VDKDVLSRIPKNREIYILIDCGAFLVSYLRYRLVTWNKANITPFIKILDVFMRLSLQNPKAKFLFFIDNGVSEKLKSLYGAYKSNRRHSIKRRSDRFIAADPTKSNDYVINRTLLCKFFINLGHAVFYYSEADYQLGYALNKLKKKYEKDSNDIYVLSHDNDLMSLIEYSNCIHKVAKNKANKDNYKLYKLYDVGDYESYVQNMRVGTYEEYIIMKSLSGDDVDNIMKPIMIDDRFVKALFNKYKYDFGYATLDSEKTFEIIRNKVLKKVKDSTEYGNIEERLAYEFRRNYLIFDIYNSEPLFANDELRYINTTLDALMNNKITKNLEESRQTLRRVSQTYLALFDKWIMATKY